MTTPEFIAMIESRGFIYEEPEDARVWLHFKIKDNITIIVSHGLMNRDFNGMVVYVGEVYPDCVKSQPEWNFHYEDPDREVNVRYVMDKIDELTKYGPQGLLVKIAMSEVV